MGNGKGPARRAATRAAAALSLGALVTLCPGRAATAEPTGGEAGGRPALFLGNEALPPMNYLKNGVPTGIVVDLVKALAKHMHRPVEIRLMNWGEAQQFVAEGRADALQQINASPERLKLYDFSDPLLVSEFTIFTAGDRVGISSLIDLRGLRVGVEKKGLPILLLRRDPEILVQVVPDFARGFRLLTTGALDAVVADRWVGSYVLAENNIRGVKLVDPPVSESASAIAVKKGDAALLADINGGLAAIRRNGTYDKILDAWRSKEVVFQTREHLVHQAWLLAAISGALVLALAGVVTLTREIRRRKRVEASLQASEDKYRSLFNQSVEGIYLHDLDGRLLDVNRAACRQVGYAREELLALTLFDLALTPGEPNSPSREALLARWKGWQHEQTYTFEGELRRHDGTRLPVALSAGVIRYGQSEVVLAIVQDISARRQAERDMQRVISELRNSLAEIKTLRGIVPICAHCKKIRDDKGFWSQVETYVTEHTEAQFSHGICPQCVEVLYPGVAAKGGAQP